jgi:hypothetical protein
MCKKLRDIRNIYLKKNNCYFCEHCIVKDTLYDFECEISKHPVIDHGTETDYFWECKGKDFVRE